MAKEKWLMPEEKAKRLATALIAAGVLVVLFLVAVIVVQFVRISEARKENERYERALEELQQQIEQDRRDLDFFESELGMYHQAVERGWKTR